ncbi:glucans biosynthesis protein G [Pseudodonghicola xiamenensis]|uniref:Glucans biosynthesis protein G n=2 Tax=Pseudodonghicola xiamenensis TaxID=337702 RepID=A0A8J3H8A6_9RHOB|nr:glucans biosynthesis protein G [Pseudodonghicola xiamenensis]
MPGADGPEAADTAVAPQETQPPFDFESLAERMRLRAETPDKTTPVADSFLTGLSYDDYQQIQFNPARARWQEEPSDLFRAEAFHLGWLFQEPVKMFEVVDAQPRPMNFDVADFLYHGDLAARVPADEHLPGVAGFRLSTPLNRADTFDELIAFLGASYFRALGRGNVYGLSARGLAVNTGISGAEEFPRFTEFYLERPAAGADHVTLFAALESPSLTGAYRFVVTPGENTVVEVSARLFLRDDIEQLGVAPLTSMYLFGANDPGQFDDYRPQVHDSEALAFTEAGGRVHWRPLRNPPELASSYFTSGNLTSFGLYQRDRDWNGYLDAQAQYHRRPSLKVEPLGDWGKGAVRLVEIPSELETNDNIVAFWVPAEPTRAGDVLNYSYRLSWGMLPPDTGAMLAWVKGTRVGHGGVSGMKAKDDSQKFVIDFADGLLGRLPEDAELTPVITVSKGKIVQQSLSKIPGQACWRLVFDLSAPKDTVIELSAEIEGYGRKLTENWLSQWIRP